LHANQLVGLGARVGQGGTTACERHRAEHGEGQGRHDRERGQQPELPTAPLEPAGEDASAGRPGGPGAGGGDEWWRGGRRRGLS
jgi:hypothetical protein